MGTRAFILAAIAPARTPAAAIDKLNAAVNGRLQAPEFKTSIAKLALEVRSMMPQQFDAKLADEARNWDAAVRESGVKID